jgi:hypothetical protein
MSLLTAPTPVLYPTAEQSNVLGIRYVDPAVRLHSWSIPTPRCIHDVMLGQSCDACDAELAD